MSDYYDAATPREYYVALQRRINDGSIWNFEGAAGRGAMDAIEAGLCVLGKQPHRDYYGNRIPSRYEVKRGTKGSVAYARQRQGDRWQRMIVRVK